ncbi:hypothetical protein ACR6HW_06610 [Fusibacter sp. JL298sf-3]
MRQPLKTKELAEIAMIVAAIVAGGYVIYLIMGQVPLPGVKYTAMAPYLALMVAFIKQHFKRRYIVLTVNTVFALIMGLVNLYMGLAIVSVGLLTTLVEVVSDGSRWRVQIAGAAYGAFCVGVSLAVSKYLIGSALFEKLTPQYMGALVAIAAALGVVGAYAGIWLDRRINRR